MATIDRKLATIRRISEIHPIEGADQIEVAQVDGWKVVVKKGEFRVREPALYIEIDSWVPTEIAPFLSKGKEPSVYNNVKGERLRSVKLRGQISQGLLIKLEHHIGESVLPFDHVRHVVMPGEDVTQKLGIQKWEAPIPAQLAGIVKGSWPSSVPRTDQERVQNLHQKLINYMNMTFEVTEKLDGSSCSMGLIDGEFYVMSRNLSLKEAENNTFWRMARKYDIEQKMRDVGLDNTIIQGEVCGPQIQKNSYSLSDHEFFVFDIICLDPTSLDIVRTLISSP